MTYAFTIRNYKFTNFFLNTIEKLRPKTSKVSWSIGGMKHDFFGCIIEGTIVITEEGDVVGVININEGEAEFLVASNPNYPFTEEYLRDIENFLRDYFEAKIRHVPKSHIDIN